MLVSLFGSVNLLFVNSRKKIYIISVLVIRIWTGFIKILVYSVVKSKQM